MSSFKDYAEQEDIVEIGVYKDGKEVDWIKVYGKMSDAHRDAETAARRYLLDCISEDESNREEAIEEATMMVVSSCIHSWSFDEEATPENFREFLGANKSYVDKIDNLLARKGVFFTAK